MSRDDWRQSVPDAETFEQLFDKARRKSEVPAAPRTGVTPIKAPPRPEPRPQSRVVISAIPSPPPSPQTPAPPKAPPEAPDEPRPAPAVIRFGTAPPMAPAGPPLRFVAPSAPSVMRFDDLLSNDSPPPKAALAARPSLDPAPPAAPTPPVVRFGPPPPGPALPDPEALPPPRRQLATLPFLQKRTLTTAGSIAVSAVTAAAVVSLALATYAWRYPTVPPVIPSSEPLPPLTAAPAPPPPPATATVAAPAPTPSEQLPLGYGRLFVVSSRDADVYLSGRRAGPANDTLEVRCGMWFIRLARPGEDFPPEWVGAGETVRVACQGTTKVELRPSQSSLVLKRH